jgi:uncharacterized protein (DUF1015 family)
MTHLIRPFRALRPTPDQAAAVAAPPYDVLSSSEARQRAAGRPHSFLHISKPEIDLPEGTDPYSAAVYARGAENLARLITEGVLVREDRPAYYAYQITMDDHQQTGLACVSSVEAYRSNRIRKHELTRPDKENDRVRQIDALNAQTGPVLLAYRSSAAIKSILADVTATPPLLDVTADDGVIHRIWLIAEPERVAAISQQINAMAALYIADGHHRSAAAMRVAEQRAAADSAGAESYPFFLTVAFPDDEMRILDYNRVVADLNGLTPQQLLAAAAEKFAIEASDQAVRPRRPGEFGMYLAGHWHRLTIAPGLIPQDDPVASLDVSLLQDHLIEPLLGVSDPRIDKRIDFVGGIRGLAELKKRVDSGSAAVAFALFPTRMSALMAVADANALMPPKSTWFEPKLADGLLSHVLD